MDLVLVKGRQGPNDMARVIAIAMASGETLDERVRLEASTFPRSLPVRASVSLVEKRTQPVEAWNRGENVAVPWPSLPEATSLARAPGCCPQCSPRPCASGAQLSTAGFWAILQKHPEFPSPPSWAAGSTWPATS